MIRDLNVPKGELLVDTEEELRQLNEEEFYGPMRAVNGHLMCYPVVFPKDGYGNTRNYVMGDRIRYTQYNAYCHDTCDHTELGPLPDY